MLKFQYFVTDHQDGPSSIQRAVDRVRRLVLDLERFQNQKSKTTTTTYVTKFEDPLSGSSKARPRRASRSVKPLTGRGINQPRPGVQQNVGINQPRVVDENKGVEGVVHPQRQPIVPRGRAQHPAHMIYEKDDADLDGAGAIALPALPPCVKFTITSTMIQLLNLKGMFRGAVGDDASSLDKFCGNLNVTRDSWGQPNNNEVEADSIVSYWRGD
uniref:Integrase core domain containing protein n=1 Tax=Solanum tuberosum TaxID=4113 RepID=M1DTX6_SOLTU